MCERLLANGVIEDFRVEIGGGADLAVRWGVVTFPGSNDDRDALRVAERVLGDEAVPLWHKDDDLARRRLRRPAGRLLVRRLPALRRDGALLAGHGGRRARTRAAGGLVLGICNGFQILCEAGLLPGALVRNRSLSFVCDVVTVRVETNDTPFTHGCRPGEVLDAADQARRGLLRRRRGHARGARARRPRRLPLRRPAGRVGAGGEPERLARATSPACATRSATSSA